MGGCNMNFVDNHLKRAFRCLGAAIGRNPGYFVIIPVLLTALCASGFQRVKFEADPEYLFSPTNGEAKSERAILEKHFPTNYQRFEPTRVSKGGRFGRLIITAADGGSLLRTKVWREINFLDEIVTNLTIQWEEEDLSFRDLCAVDLKGNCWNNEILTLGAYIKDIERRDVNLTYPVWFSPDFITTYTWPQYLGGFNISEDMIIESVEAISLFYFLDTTDEWQVKRGSAWEATFLASMAAQNLSNINIFRFTSLTLEMELEDNTNSVIPYFSLNIGIMVLFCIVTCMMTDWVKSKPLLGLLGVVSAILGSISAFGLVMYLGMDFIGINLAAPFLMLGIGIDDTFVMLASWRRTSVHDSVPKRMASCYSDAAVSITITSITDMLSFWIGVITPFPCVQIFCVYTGACVAFTYFWHITFFGGCMAIAGYAEKQNRHAITCCVVMPKSQAGPRNWLYRVFCSGGINQEDPYNPKDNKENGMMVFFRDRVGTWLNKPSSKAFVLTIFLIYVGFAAWGVTNLKEGLQKRRLSRFDSYSVDFYDAEDKYFRTYPFRINVVVSGELDYSKKEVQDDMAALLTAMENTTYIDGPYTESWLSALLDYVDRWGDYEGTDLDISDEQKLIKFLQEVYLFDTNYVLDVDFQPKNCSADEDCTGKQSIVGSRFILQGHNIYDANDEAQVVRDLRQICENSKYNVTVFHPYFIYFDQFLIVLPTTIQCVLIAALVMMVVSLIFIPNPICSLWVAFSIISIELGVLGFMTLWGVNLDSISMINLIMCIGFSVDFSAHISYHYLDSEGPPDEKVKNSLYGLGLPIVQGAISTILGVIGLMLAPSYIFITFFKMVFLVILLGAVHGLFLLPVLLSIFGPGSCSKNEKKRLKTPASSYLSDTLPSKDKRKGHMFDFPESGLRIPRPATTISLSTATPTTDIDTSESSPGSAQTSNRSKEAITSQPGRRGRQLHEMYHNNGYLSEEDLEDHMNTWRTNPRGGHGGAASNKLINFNNYPPYAYPTDGHPSFRHDQINEYLGEDGRHKSHNHQASRSHSKSNRKRDSRHSHSREGSSTTDVRTHSHSSRSRDNGSGASSGSYDRHSQDVRGGHVKGRHSGHRSGKSHCKRSKSKEHTSRRDM